MKTNRISLIVLIAGILGISISIYLTAVHYSNIPLICSGNGLINCEQVLNSSYSLIGGTTIPTSAAGIVWFLVVIGLALFRLRQDSNLLKYLQLGWAFIGTVTALNLIYAEIVKINAICLWCTAVHILVFLILILSLTSTPFIKNWLHQ